MADRWAFVVGIDKYLHPGIGSVPAAEADAASLAAALGIPPERLTLLRGPQATRAVVAAKLKRLRKYAKRGDELFAVWVGRGLTAAGRGLLPCWDVLPDVLADTSVAVADWVETFTTTKAGQVVFLFATGAGDAPGDLQPYLDDDELRGLVAGSPNAVALAATTDDEPTQVAGKHGVWSQLVAEALTGEARSAAGKDGRITAHTLQRYIEAELPRRLRKHYEAGVRQTPQLIGDAAAGAVIADLSAHFAAAGEAAVLDPGRLRRVVFRSEATTKVRDLSQFRKTFQVPDNAGPSSRKFIARVAAPDVRADLDRVFDAAREQLGYKRKDLALSAGQDGYGSLRTPDFEYTVFVDLDPEDPSRLVWRREAGQFPDPGFVRGPGFAAVFKVGFDQLVFEFARPVDVGEFVDRIEDDPPPGVKLSLDSEGKACDITLAGFAGVVTVKRHALTVRGRSGPSAGLLDLFLQFVKTFGTPGEPKALPPKPGD